MRGVGTPGWDTAERTVAVVKTEAATAAAPTTDKTTAWWILTTVPEESLHLPALVDKLLLKSSGVTLLLLLVKATLYLLSVNHFSW